MFFLFRQPTYYLYVKQYFMDELTKRKISASLRGRKKTATHRKKISQALLNRKLTKEHKENIRKSMKR